MNRKLPGTLPAVLCLAGMLLLPARAARAATPVMPDPRPPRTGAYDDAAAELGFRPWGSASRNAGGAHAMLLLQAGKCRLTVALPPGTSRDDGELWLTLLARDMRWAGADLYSSPQ